MGIHTTELTQGFHINQVINGLWQVSGTHGPINPIKALAQMHDYYAADLNTWDVADHYGPAEDFVGTFMEELEDQHGHAARGKIRVLTKWVPTASKGRFVPDLDYTLKYVEKNIDRSLCRLRIDSLDVLQFHWWDYADKRILDVFEHLKTLQDKGKIKHLAVTNFDAENLAYLLSQGIQIVSNQVRFSIIDRRAEKSMLKVCDEYHVKLIAFGTLCGGLLQEKYLGQDDPQRDIPFEQKNLYHKHINMLGGWEVFQHILKVLNPIAKKYAVFIASIASQYILDYPQVAAVIVGARLGESNYIEETKKIGQIQLSEEDRANIESVLSECRHFYDLLGPVASEYRGQSYQEQVN